MTSAESARTDLVFRQPSRAAQIDQLVLLATCFGCARGIMAVVEQLGARSRGERLNSGGGRIWSHLLMIAAGVHVPKGPADAH